MAGMVRSRAARIVLLGLGWVFVGIGFAGVVLPLVPTTGPILLAAFLFSLSSVRFDRWLSEHRVFGPIVRDWRAGEGFTLRLKVTAIVAIMVTFTISMTFAVENTVVRLLLKGLEIALVVYIIRLPTKPGRPALATGDA